MRLSFFLQSVLFFLCFTIGVSNGNAQESKGYQDTLKVKGANSNYLSSVVTYWVDTTNKATVYKAAEKLSDGGFKHWELNSTLNLGANPHPLWLHLRVKSIYEYPSKFWFSFYTHADTITFFEKNNASWKEYDRLMYATPFEEREIQVRFSTTKVALDSNEYKEFLVKVENYRHTQNAIIDFTTPEDNLLWERDFYLSVGFFIGCFILIATVSIFVGISMREKIQFIYALYLLIIIAMSFMEELMVPVISISWLFKLLIRSHSLPLAIIALGLNFRFIYYIINSKGDKPNMGLKVIRFANKFLTGFGVFFYLVYLLFMEHLRFGDWKYDLLWYGGIGSVVLIMLLTLCIPLLFYMEIAKKVIVFGVVLVALYFNPAGYFLNYSGVLNYYEITYPNYLYWIVCFQFIIIGVALSWRYRGIEKRHMKLLEEKAEQDEKMLRREIQIQEQERKQIANDLHDDLGATISAMKLIISNSYAKDITLLYMVSRANRDLRHFFNKLSLPDPKDNSIFGMVREKVREFNAVGDMEFVFLGIGNETEMPGELKITIFRICTELLSNALKHSEASEVTLQIFLEPELIQIILEDNGVGFDIESQKYGNGLRSLQERADYWKGEVHISSSDSGTTTIVTLRVV